MDPDGDALVAGVALLEAEEDGQIDAARQLDAQRPDGDAAGSGAGRVADRQATAERPQDQLDRVGRGVGAAENLRLIGEGGGTSRTLISLRNPPRQVTVAPKGVPWGGAASCRFWA
jgi:hypothetical protein